MASIHSAPYFVLALAVSAQDSTKQLKYDLKQLEHGVSCGEAQSNKACWNGDAAAEELCCRTKSDSKCWDEKLTRRRCCPRVSSDSRRPNCSPGDLVFLDEVWQFHLKGFLPSTLRPLVLRDPEPLILRLRSATLDDEVELCPVARLVELLLMAEFVAALETAEAFRVVDEVVAYVDVLGGAAKAQRHLSFSSLQYPDSLLTRSHQRLFVVKRLYMPGGSILDAFLADMSCRPGHVGCLVVMKGSDRCTRNHDRTKSPRRIHPFILSILVEVLVAAPHSFAIRARMPGIGSQSVVLAQLLMAAQLRGLSDSASFRHFSLATNSINSVSSEFGVNLNRLRAAARAVAAAMSNNTEGSFAEFGKDAHISEVLEMAGVSSRTYVEFGTGRGYECNSRFLRQHLGWRGIMLDQGGNNEAIGQYRRLLSPENINDVFAEVGVPHEIDLLSIDVDGTDFHLWQAINGSYRPRVVIIEYVGALGNGDVVARYFPDLSALMNYAVPDHRQVSILGASLRALVQLARVKGYRLVKVRHDDAFFVRADIDVLELSVPQSPESVLRKAARKKLLEDAHFFYTTSTDAIKGDGVMKSSWSAACLAEAFDKICNDSVVGQLCWHF